MHEARKAQQGNCHPYKPSAVLHNHTKIIATIFAHDCLFLPVAQDLRLHPPTLRPTFSYAASSDTVVFNIRSPRPPSTRLRKRLFRPHRVHPYPRTRYGGRSRHPTTSPRKSCPNPGTGRQPMANSLTHQSNAHKAKAKRATRPCQKASETAQRIHPLSQR
jgi:hypothetical protein